MTFHVSPIFRARHEDGSLGARFCNGFELQERLVGTKKMSHIRPFCRIKRDDRHHVRFDMKGAVVLDLATAAFGYTDRPATIRSKVRVEPLASRAMSGREPIAARLR